MAHYVVGIDIGGTNLKFGLVNRFGQVMARSHLVTQNYLHSRPQLIEAMVRSIDLLLKKNDLTAKDILGIGIGLPGLIDPHRGIVHFLPNIPGWKKVPLKKILEQRLRIKTFLENDVNLITLGEWKFGAGVGYKNLVCITLGTGVGSGLIFNNELYRGEGYVAGEIGHMPLNEQGPACSCGGYACFQRYVGNRHLLDKARKIFRDQQITLPRLRGLARRRDPRALAFWEETAMHIGNNLVGVVNLLNPPLVIIGGGVSNNYRFLFKTIRKVIRRRAMKVHASMVKIVRAKRGDDAGILGAFVLVKDENKRK